MRFLNNCDILMHVNIIDKCYTLYQAHFSLRYSVFIQENFLGLVSQFYVISLRNLFLKPKSWLWSDTLTEVFVTS